MNRLFRRLETGLATATLAMLPLSAAIAAPTIALTGPASVERGAPFAVQVSALDVTDLYAFQFDVTFDPALFTASGVTEGAFLASGGTTFFDGGTIDNTSGVVSFVFDTLIGAIPGVSGSGVLARIDFNAADVAFSSGAFQLTDAMALDSSLDLVDVALRGQSVAIPEPAALSLSLAALAVLGASSWRRRAAGSVAREGR